MSYYGLSYVGMSISCVLVGEFFSNGKEGQSGRGRGVRAGNHMRATHLGYFYLRCCSPHLSAFVGDSTWFRGIPAAAVICGRSMASPNHV